MTDKKFEDYIGIFLGSLFIGGVTFILTLCICAAGLAMKDIAMIKEISYIIAGIVAIISSIALMDNN